jgi:hypothetical protein
MNKKIAYSISATIILLVIFLLALHYEKSKKTTTVIVPKPNQPPPPGTPVTGNVIHVAMPVIQGAQRNNYTAPTNLAIQPYNGTASSAAEHFLAFGGYQYGSVSDIQQNQIRPTRAIIYAALYGVPNTVQHGDDIKCPWDTFRKDIYANAGGQYQWVGKNTDSQTMLQYFPLQNIPGLNQPTTWLHYGFLGGGIGGLYDADEDQLYNGTANYAYNIINWQTKGGKAAYNETYVPSYQLTQLRSVLMQLDAANTSNLTGVQAANLLKAYLGFLNQLQQLFAQLWYNRCVNADTQLSLNIAANTASSAQAAVNILKSIQ